MPGEIDFPRDPNRFSVGLMQCSRTETSILFTLGAQRCDVPLSPRSVSGLSENHRSGTRCHPGTTELLGPSTPTLIIAGFTTSWDAIRC